MALLGHDAFVHQQGTAQQVAIGAASAASAAFGSQTRWIRVAASGFVGTTTNLGCRILVGDGTPTALATSAFLPYQWVEYITVNPGEKIAVIQDGTAVAGNNLSIVELS